MLPITTGKYLLSNERVVFASVEQLRDIVLEDVPIVTPLPPFENAMEGIFVMPVPFASAPFERTLDKWKQCNPKRQGQTKHY